MRKLLAEINEASLARKVHDYLRENVVWKKEVNEYGVTTSKVLLTIRQVNALNRRTLAYEFFEAQSESSSLKRLFAKYVEEHEKDLDKAKHDMNMILAKIIDYRLPILYAGIYTGNPKAKVLLMNFIEDKGLQFKYNASKEKLIDERIIYEDRKKEISERITKSQLGLLTRLLLAQNMTISMPPKNLDKYTADKLIQYLTIGTPLDEETQRMVKSY